MDEELKERLIGLPKPPSSTKNSSGLWTELQELYRNQFTRELRGPRTFSLATAIALYAIIFFFNTGPYHVNFTVKTFSVSPSSATCHIDFLVENPSLLRSIYYKGDDLYVKLGPLNAAVLKTSLRQHSHGRMSFSVDFATESNRSDVVAASYKVFELDMKLGANVRKAIMFDVYGHFDIKCRNLMIGGHEKVKCYSSFKELELCCKSSY